MAVFRVERTSDYTVMSNCHLKDKRLSLKAKGLLSQMLSLPDDWDYTLSGLCYINRESKDAIRSAIHELEQAGYIRRRQTTDAGGKFAGNEYSIFERPVEPVTTPPSGKPSSGNPTTETPSTEKPPSENPTQLNTYRQNTNPSNTDSILFRATAAIPPEPNRSEAGWRGTREQYRALICRNVQYQTLLARYPDDADILTEMVELIVDTVCAQRKTTRVCGADYPHEVVKAQLLKLDAEHIQFVLRSLHENTTKVRNIKQYLLAALYNAPVTISCYVRAQVNHDLNGCADQSTKSYPATPEERRRT